MSTLALGIVRIQIESSGSKKLKIFVPILLLALILLPVILVAAPFYALVALISAVAGNFFLIKAPAYVVQLIEAASGTEILIEESQSKIFIQIV